IPREMCSTETLQIPMPLVFKSKVHSALLHDVIHRNTRQRLYTGAFPYLVDVTNRYRLLAQFHCGLRGDQHRFGKPEAGKPHFAVSSTCGGPCRLIQKLTKKEPRFI